MECSPALRDALVGKGSVYIGWDVIHVEDFVSVTCCSKCQQYGHPERYCRAKEDTCGNCGNVGHRKDSCTSATSACATCKRFGKPDAHKTASTECPARKHAEARQLSMTNYG